MSRMDRYKSETSPLSRTSKNQELYQNVSNNTIYANITDVTNANAFEIKNNNITSRTTRESYQQMKKYQNVEPIPRTRKELDDFNYLYPKKENKVYDINSVLEAARKNRVEKDNKEEKRKLKNNAYNILSGVNKEALEKYREEKKKRMLTPEEEEIRELVDTIASKTLAGEIDKATSVDLLSDLMATNMLDKVSASRPPLTTPGIINGNVTFVNTLNLLAPKSIAASSYSFGSKFRVDLTLVITKGIEKAIWEIIILTNPNFKLAIVNTLNKDIPNTISGITIGI